MNPVAKKEKPINWKRLLQRESVRIEWKENVADERGIVKTLCAFANDIQQVGGGRVICGIREEQDENDRTTARAVGLDARRHKEIKNKVLNICHRQVEPSLTPVTRDYPVEDNPSRSILIFEVPASQYAHRYRVKDEGAQYYVRVNDRTQPADGLLARLLEQKKQWPPYLDQTHPDAGIEAIDRYALAEFMGKIDPALPLDRYLEPDVHIRGDVQSLVTYPPGNSELHVPRNFTLLIFGKEPHLFFRGAYAILSIYQGKDKLSGRIRRFEIFGPIPHLVRNILDKLQLHTGIDIDKNEDMFNGDQNRLRYSAWAIREAIVNAFVHRDYHSHEPVRVTVFDDRIEVTNPGGLYHGIDLELLKQGKAHPAWRNPSLAWFMVELDLAQNEGLGIRMIVDATMKIAGEPPIFNINPDWFTLVIPAFNFPGLKSEVAQAESLTGKEGLLLISIGGESIENQVKESLSSLGLQDADIAVNFTAPGYVESQHENWEKIASDLKKEIQKIVDLPEYRRFHLFYKGPVVFAPLLGAIVGPAKKLALYAYENGKYFYTHTIDRKFIKE